MRFSTPCPPTNLLSSIIVVLMLFLFLTEPTFAQHLKQTKRSRKVDTKPLHADSLKLKSVFQEAATPVNPIFPGADPGIGDPNGCIVCPDNNLSFPEANWFIHPDNNTAFLCGNTGPLSFGFNAAHGQGQGVNGVESIPYRYTFNLANPTSGNRVFEGIGILAPMNATASPPGQINCNGLLLSPYWGVSTNNNNPLTLGTNNGSNRTMEIFSNGNVGIGVGGVSPAETFAVNGTTLLNGNTTVSGATTTNSLQVTGVTTLAGAVNTGPLTVNTGSTNSGKLWRTDASGQTEWVPPGIVFDVTGTENMVAKFNSDGVGLDNSDIFNKDGKVRIGAGSGEIESKLEVIAPSSTTEQSVFKATAGVNFMRYMQANNGTGNRNFLDFGHQISDGSSITEFRKFYTNGAPRTFLKTVGENRVLMGFGEGLQIHGQEFGESRVLVGKSTDVTDLYNASLRTMGSIRIGRNTGTPTDDNRLIFSGGESVFPSGDGENNCGIWFQRKNISNSKSALQLHFGGMESADPAQVSRLEIGYHDGPQTSNTIKRRIALYANGEIQARKVKVTLDDLADYVFKPDYKLCSLKETEAYIKANGHLPEVPSQAEVAKDGMDVGEMNNILLKKIEEMTLHLIRMEKEIEALKSKK